MRMIGGRDRAELRSDLLPSLLLGLAYYLAARLSLELALVDENITPLWPPSGIALVGFLLFGSRLWPGVALAAFVVNLPISGSALAALVTAAGNTLAPIAAAVMLRRVGFRPQLDRLRDALAIVIAALASTTISATIGATTLLVSGAIAGDGYLAAWSVWWAGDAMGILVVAPVLFTLTTIREHPIPRGWKVLEAAVLAGLLLGICSMTLATDLPFYFLLFPVLGWAAWRFQQPGATPAALLVSGFATWAAVEGRGPFEGLGLSEQMFTLQSFNASVALTSFFFAAIVSERLRARRALEEAAAELEERVQARTAELSATNERLAEAQQLAHLGSWEWDVATGSVTWSEEMYRIHGMVADGEPMTFERAIDFAEIDERERIRANVERAIETRTETIPDLEYRIVRPDGDMRTLYGKARLVLADDGSIRRMVGTVEDVTVRRGLEREHRIAETLQQALLPQRLPHLVGIGLAARYVPAEEGSSAGGDWYDVLELPGGGVGLVIGDVAGHGSEAASVMGQVRMAVRAFSLEGHPPAIVVGLVHDLIRSLYDGEQMVTMLFVTVEPTTWEATVVNAGHPPPLVLDPAGGASFLEGPVGLPVGLNWSLPYEGSIARLRPGSVLVLFTDGLVDRRDVPVEEGLARLRTVAGELADRERDIEELCGSLILSLVPEDASDDVAVLAARLDPVGDRLSLRIPADPSKLASVRRNLARWLTGHDVPVTDADDIVLASSEACANAVEHAYGPGQGSVDLDAEIDGGTVIVVVTDAGSWREARVRDRGRGLALIEACMDRCDVTTGPTGTELRMRRRIRRPSV
ncbi:MAG TPA: MASE1 domain-containing protein [Actinomycetota bacterium]|nr:MASE1 domain-containing protein [Actinomycetota bacterium]